MPAPAIAVLGSTGKVGRRLQATWGPDRLPALWLPGRLPPGQPLPPVLVLLSGVTSGDASALAANRAIGLTVASAAVAAGVRWILLASTMAVYGRTPPGGAAEDDPPVTPRPYGVAKLEMEQAMAAQLAGTETGLTALRIGNVIGADLLGMIAAAGRPVVLDRFADGAGPQRSYAGAGLLVRVIDALARRVLVGESLPPVLNVATQAPVAMADLLVAAGMPFGWQPAGPAAWQVVSMDCRRLATLMPPDPADEIPTALAADWRLGSA